MPSDVMRKLLDDLDALETERLAVIAKIEDTLRRIHALEREIEDRDYERSKF